MRTFFTFTFVPHSKEHSMEEYSFQMYCFHICAQEKELVDDIETAKVDQMRRLWGFNKLQETKPKVTASINVIMIFLKSTKMKITVLYELCVHVIVYCGLTFGMQCDSNDVTMGNIYFIIKNKFRLTRK